MSTQPTVIKRSERMFAHRPGIYKPLLAIALLIGTVALLSGCGGSSDSSGAATVGGESSGKDGPTGEAPDVSGADPGDVEVITGWADTLSSGDPTAAAEFFAIPSVAENGVKVEIKSTKAAVLFNTALPCGAELTSAETTGTTTTATFRLFNRPGADCGQGAGGRGVDLVRDRGRQDRRVAQGREWRRRATTRGHDDLADPSASTSAPGGVRTRLRAPSVHPHANRHAGGHRAPPATSGHSPEPERTHGRIYWPSPARISPARIFKAIGRPVL